MMHHRLILAAMLCLCAGFARADVLYQWNTTSLDYCDACTIPPISMSFDVSSGAANQNDLTSFYAGGLTTLFPDPFPPPNPVDYLIYAVLNPDGTLTGSVDAFNIYTEQELYLSGSDLTWHGFIESPYGGCNCAFSGYWTDPPFDVPEPSAPALLAVPMFIAWRMRRRTREIKSRPKAADGLRRY